MTKKQFIEQTVLATISSGKWGGTPESMWEWADSIWQANPNKGSDPENSTGKRFIPPTTEEVDAYIEERGYKEFNGRKFCNFYASKDWKVGKNKMKDWKAAVRTWGEKEMKDSNGNAPKIGFV